MSRCADDDRELRIDPESFAGGYFKHAVYNHWDHYEDIPQSKLDTDRERFIEDDPTEAEFDELRTLVAIDGAEQAGAADD
ncbi:MAG: ribonucleoside-diphosphate reductase beta chain [Natronomonas sp.]|uniref:hypothetical protein n=1 Tax=Natronomonas sp. TaxID=2184060 RepID=UPI003989F9E1